MKKYKDLNRKQKNLAGIVFIILLFVIAFVVYQIFNKTTTLNQNFHITNIHAINKIVIKDSDNKTLILEKQPDNQWLVNKKHPANMTLVNTVLETFKNMRIREPLPKAARNNVVKELATHSKTVEVYMEDYAINIWFIKLFKSQRLKRTYFVGTETPDEMGTFMLRKGDNTPYVVYIPNFRGYLATRFSVIEDLWRSHNIFKYKQSEISSIKVELPNDKKENYTLINNGNGFSFQTYDGTLLSDFDTNKVVAFLSCFVEMNYERVATNISKIEQDTIFTKQPSFIITITDKNNEVSTLKTFVKLSDPNSIAQDDNDFYQIFDINRCYAISDKIQDTLVMQFYVLDNVLQPASYFYQSDSRLPYVK